MKKKSMIALFLALVLGFQLLPAGALAAETVQTQQMGSLAAEDTGLTTMAASSSTVKLSSVQNISKKAIKVTWKKKSGVTGYQVQYSTSSKMKSAKTVTVKKAKTTSVTISKLKKGKKYYVRVRAYTKKNGKTQYTAWSGKKNVVFRGRMLTQKEVVAIAEKYWNVKSGEINSDMGFEMGVFCGSVEKTNGKYYYGVYLKWLVDNRYWSSVDRINVDAYSGACTSGY